jgi:hypothetical protein
MTNDELLALKAGDLIGENGIFQVIENDTVRQEVEVTLLRKRKGIVSYDDLGAAQKIAYPSLGGGGGGATSGEYVAKSGDTMSGPLAILTATQPELHLADDAGVITFDLSNSKLRLADSVVGNSVDISLATVLLQGSGAASGASANKATLGVNYLGLGHKTYQLGNAPVSFYQGNNGELFIQNHDGSVNLALTDLVNGFIVKVSADAGNLLTHGTDKHLFAPAPAPLDLSNYVQKSGDNMTGTLTVLGPEQYVLCENPSTGEQVMVSPANIFFKRPQFNAAFFLRAGEGGNLYFQDQATGKVIQLTDLASAP